tara:strand:+ start:9801 stop:11192 length:1392 start_codon:yes stop_codon:yes gene_type:complete
MKITRRQLRRLLSERLLVEASAEELANMKGTYSINPQSAQSLGFAGAQSGAGQIKVGPRGNVNVGTKDGNFIREIKPSEVTPEQLNYITLGYDRKQAANNTVMGEMSTYFRKNAGYYKVNNQSGVPAGATHIRIYGDAKYRYINFNEKPEKYVGAKEPIAPSVFLGWKSFIDGLTKDSNPSSADTSTEGETDTSAERDGEQQQQQQQQQQPKPEKKNKPKKSADKDKKVAFIRKVIGDDAPGKWNKESDKKWKTWVEGPYYAAGVRTFQNFYAMVQLGKNNKTNATEEDFDAAHKENNAVSLAKLAGFKPTISGVYNMCKEIDEMSKEDLQATAMAITATTEGETNTAASKAVDKDEVITQSFTDDIKAEMFGDEIAKIQDPREKSRAVKNVVNAYNKKKEELKKKGDEREIQNLDRGFKLFKKRSKASKEFEAASEKVDEIKDLQESLSRGALYRKHYYGRY